MLGTKTKYVGKSNCIFLHLLKFVKNIQFLRQNLIIVIFLNFNFLKTNYAGKKLFYFFTFMHFSVNKNS